MSEKQNPLKAVVIEKYGKPVERTLVELDSVKCCYTCKSCKADEYDSAGYRCTLNPPQYAGQVQHHQATVRWEQPRVTLQTTCRQHEWWNR